MKYSDRSIACAYCNKQMRRRNLKRHCLSLHPGKETQENQLVTNAQTNSPQEAVSESTNYSTMSDQLVTNAQTNSPQEAVSESTNYSTMSDNLVTPVLVDSIQESLDAKSTAKLVSEQLPTSMPYHDNSGYIGYPTDPYGDWRTDHRIPKAYKERPRSMSENHLQGRYPSRPTKNIHVKKEVRLNDIVPNTQTPTNELHEIPNGTSDSVYDDYSLCSYFSCCRNRKYSAKQSRKKKKVLKLCLAALVVIIYVAFFITALNIHSEYDDNDYWCRGDGFLIVISCIIAVMLSYFQIAKPLLKRIFGVKKEIDEFGQEPNCCRKILSHRCFKVPIYIIAVGAAIAFLVYDSLDESERLYSLMGVVTLLSIGFLISKAPRKIKWEIVIWGLGFQFVFGLIILRWPTGRKFFECFSRKVSTFLAFTDAGSEFVFGFNIENGVFAFKVLSVILFFSMVIQILYFYGVMQWLVIKIGWALQVTVGTTACESTNAAANIFLGQTEAPILVKPYLGLMTKSELHAIMTGGFATIAGTVLAAYISFGVNAAQLMTASVMNAPTALAMSKLIYPEVEKSNTASANIKAEKGKEVNVLHAAIEGISSAIPLLSNIGASLLAFIAFVAMVDEILNWLCVLVSIDDGVCSLSSIFGYIFTPLAFVMGVPWADCNKVGQLIGTKIFVNEFVAYVALAGFIRDSALTKRAETIATFALCGFGNISSIGIQIGGLGAMAPDRKGDMASIALRAVIAGTFATFMTACIAGTMVSPSVMNDASMNITNSTGL